MDKEGVDALHGDSYDGSAGHKHLRCVDDVAMNNKVRRKLDYCVMPCLIFMYLANYVDRSNLAAARLKGLQTDLGLDALQYSNALSLFFVTYVGLQPFATNLLAFVTKPTWYICGSMVAWGIISLCTGFVHNYQQLLAVRLLLGVCEAVFYPGALFTLSKFYTRSEIGKRACWFYSASLVASGFGSLFAAGVIGGLDGKVDGSAWRYLFYVEGAITVGAAMIILVILPNFPHNAYFLNAAEREFAVRRVTEDIGQVDTDDDEKWYTSLIINLKNPTTYLIGITWWCLTAGLSFNAYSPTLVQSLGFSGTNALLLNAPPYMLAIITANLNAWHSDRKQERSYHLCAGLVLAIVGCVILIATTGQAPRFVGIFLATAGYCAYPVMITWVTNCFPGKPKRRAAIIGWLTAFANSANLAGGYFFVASQFGPDYRGSFAICLAMFVTSLLFALLARFWLARKNRQLAKLEQELLAGHAEVQNNKLLQETAAIEGTDTFEAAKMAAAYRYYL